MKTDSIRNLRIDQQLGLLERAVSFNFLTADKEEFSIEHRTIPENLDADRWTIISRGYCYTRNGEWEWEPRPSSRTEEFFRATRYTLAEALEIAETLEKSNKYQK